MGLLKLAIIGGAGYFAGKKMTEHRQNMAQSQDPSQYNRQWGRCGRHQQPPQQEQEQEQKRHLPQQDQQQGQQRQHPYQPDYYNYNSVRSAEDDMYTAPTPEKRQLPQLPPYQDYNRLSHEKPLLLNFVEPQKDAAVYFPGHHIGGPGALDRI